eukprot:945420-Rhodomonas_salina.2
MPVPDIAYHTPSYATTLGQRRTWRSARPLPHISTGHGTPATLDWYWAWHSDRVGRYTPKSNTRNHNVSTFCTRNAVSCI